MVFAVPMDKYPTTLPNFRLLPQVLEGSRALEDFVLPSVLGTATATERTAEAVMGEF
jgi:hypothetical protein